MRYAILCYNSEATIATWTQEQDDAVMAGLMAVHDGLAARQQLGPVARLQFSSTAKTLRKDRQPSVVTDGPYAETKEALLGFYVVEVASEEEVLEIAQALGRANPGGAYEVRPISVFLPGADLGMSVDTPQRTGVPAHH